MPLVAKAEGENARWRKYFAAIQHYEREHAPAAARGKKDEEEKIESEEGGEAGDREESGLPKVPQANFLLRGSSPDRYLLRQMVCRTARE